MSLADRTIKANTKTRCNTNRLLEPYSQTLVTQGKSQYREKALSKLEMGLIQSNMEQMALTNANNFRESERVSS